jgi:bifunctional DNase/RNase
MKVLGLAVDEKAQSPVLILKDEARDLALPIWVGPVEAMAISLALNAVETPRPMTHDLVTRVVGELGAQLAAVEIVALREGTFYAELVIAAQAGGKPGLLRVDCRPSDAVAIAVRTGVRILVAEEVLAQAGTSTLESAKSRFADPEERDKWTDELENLSSDDLKYKM